jgi:hypothetical protein
LSRALLDSLRCSHNRGLLLGWLLGGLLGGVFNDNRRLDRSLVGDVAWINIRRRTSKRRYHADVTNSQQKKHNNKEEV